MFVHHRRCVTLAYLGSAFPFPVYPSHTRSTSTDLRSHRSQERLAKNLGLGAEPQLHVVQPA